LKGKKKSATSRKTATSEREVRSERENGKEVIRHFLTKARSIGEDHEEMTGKEEGRCGGSTPNWGNVDHGGQGERRNCLKKKESRRRGGKRGVLELDGLLSSSEEKEDHRASIEKNQREENIELGALGTVHSCGTPKSTHFRKGSVKGQGGSREIVIPKKKQ